MLALAGACLFTACDDDDDDDNNAAIITKELKYTGSSTASVMGMDIKMDDVLTVSPMKSNANMAQVSFAERTMTVMGAIPVKMDAFVIDSCVVEGTADNFKLSRKNSFAVEGVSVSLYGQESKQTVTGTFTSAELKDGAFTLKLDNVKAHESMPVTMSISFEGQASK